jgi:hypothetical protein
MVKHVVSKYILTCCSTDKTAASTCILAEGMQQADERAAKKVHCLSVPFHAILVHEAQAGLRHGHSADAAVNAYRFNGSLQWRCCCVSPS